MSAVTSVTIGNIHSAGDQRRIYGVIVFSSSYAAGGDTLTANQMGLDIVDYIDLGTVTLVAGGGTTAYFAALNAATPMPQVGSNNIKIQLFGMGSTASTGTAFNETNVADNHTYQCSFVAWGY